MSRREVRTTEELEAAIAAGDQPAIVGGGTLELVSAGDEVLAPIAEQIAAAKGARP